MRYSTSLLALTGVSLTSAYIPATAFAPYPAVAFPQPFMPNPTALHTARPPPEGVASNHLAVEPPVDSQGLVTTEDGTIIPTEKGSHNLAHASPVPIDSDTKLKETITPTEEGSHRLAHAPPVDQDKKLKGTIPAPVDDSDNTTITPTEEGSHRLAHTPPEGYGSHRLAHPPPIDQPSKTKLIDMPSVIPSHPDQEVSLATWIYSHTQYNMEGVKEKTAEECKKAKPVNNIRYLVNWPTRVENNIHGKGPNTDPLIPLCTYKQDIDPGCWNVHMAELHDKAEKMGIDGAMRSIKVNEWEKDRALELKNNCPTTDEELLKVVVWGANKELKWDPVLAEPEAREGLALLGWGNSARVTLPVIPPPTMTILPVVEDKEKPDELHILPVVDGAEEAKIPEPKIGIPVTTPGLAELEGINDGKATKIKDQIEKAGK